MVIMESVFVFFSNCHAYLLYSNQSSCHEVRSGDVFLLIIVPEVS